MNTNTQWQPSLQVYWDLLARVAWSFSQSIGDDYRKHVKILCRFDRRVSCFNHHHHYTTTIAIITTITVVVIMTTITTSPPPPPPPLLPPSSSPPSMSSP
jgi:hypothetical protein